MYGQEGDRLWFARIAHVDDGGAGAEGMRDICMAVVDHDLDAVGASALVGITQKFDVLRAVRSTLAHDRACKLTRSACPSPSIMADKLRAACQAMFCTPCQVQAAVCGVTTRFSCRNSSLSAFGGSWS